MIGWQKRHRHIDWRPNPVEPPIPPQLRKLGKVFFPIPRGKKGWNYPHHLDECRYESDDKELNAYFEVEWNYGIACSGDLAVLDADHEKVVEDVEERFPETVYQITGSRKGRHYFYIVEGLDDIINLGTQFLGEKIHVGEVRSNEHSYVVGPNSIHPSGNRYGPLHGEEIASVDRERFLRLIDPWVVGDEEQEPGQNPEMLEQDSQRPDYDPEQANPFYTLDADDVLPWLETENRIAHPVHGSTSGQNFMKNKDRETFTCWRCSIGSGPGCGINAQQFLAIQRVGNRYGEYCCEDIRRKWDSNSELHYFAWLEAVDEGLVKYTNIPYKAAQGYAVHKDMLNEGEKLSGEKYRDVIKCLKYELQSKQHPET